MPRISASSNAAQRERTQRSILDAFGELLYSNGLTDLTMTRVAKTAGVGRTAVYNYFADMGELLVAYALDKTERFVSDLNRELAAVENPVDQLGVYIRFQIEDLSRRHLPPGQAMRTVLSPEDFAKLGKHVAQLQAVLSEILQRAMDEGYLPQGDTAELSQLVHGSLTATADRSKSVESTRAQNERTQATVRFIQRGLGAQFDADFHPVRLPVQPPVLSAVS
ncbi:TetR/AcrR family transcriptional regulator [Glutamicibacter protophormiae]|uniref:HTH-type transcriptional repressor FabR n=1 Tax=Kocuria varians TaxID=1272 RepID=A0A7D7PXU8_KOCVA|nr:MULTISPECIES: TetR/AcrR family transcriptional regulator [Kocuria]WNB88777.1 TetR/AcrR family transcriptional regulator [Glutamicibacter protophormiae]MDN5631631.1 TetR/AcrR family transcriptional regulator [Kocuria sp.]QMS55716.1 HTH-type transcriptional repressor FabR [Kocuria varians]RUP85089.1 TetR/AcrR family transcriptional regulator [Kocuria sp. HSID17590]RUQ12217.1 TetR/AcrR family transcriptional regulator [Kocuria sp. HSID17582]